MSLALRETFRAVAWVSLYTLYFILYGCILFILCATLALRIIRCSYRFILGAERRVHDWMSSRVSVSDSVSESLRN